MEREDDFMFKIGDEVYVKAQVVDTDAKTFEGYNHKVQFLDSINNEWDWVSESAISDKTYSQGLEDAWELAKKILEMPHNDYVCVFGDDYTSEMMEKYTAEEALAKIEAYEREKSVCVGDVIRTNLYDSVVTRVNPYEFRVLYSDGSVGTIRKDKGFTKTGKHIDIEGILKQIGE